MAEIITMVGQYGSIALTGLFAFGVVVGLIFGLIRGWKRSLIRFCLILVCIILAAVCAPIAYNSALETDVSTIIPDSSGTLNDYVMEQVEGAAGEMGEIAVEVPEIVEAILKIVGIFVNLVTFVSLFILFRFVSWILFGLIKLIFLGRDRAKKKEAKLAKRAGYSTPKYKKGALFGGLLGIVQGTAIALAFFIPLCAVMGTVGAFTQAIGEQNLNAIIADDENEMSEILELVVALDEAYKGSVPGMIYTGTGVDKWIYGPLTTVKVGDEQFDLQSLAVLAGGVYKIMNEFGQLELPEPYTQAQFEAYLDGMLSVAEQAIPLLFDNGLIRIFINELGQAIADGTIDLTNITGNNVDYKNALTSMALIKIVEAENEQPQDDPMGDFIMDAILGLIGDLASQGNLADALKESLLAIVGTVKDLNEQQVIYPIVQLTEADENFNLFENMEMAEGIGKALDEILAVPALASFTDIMFGMIESAIGEALDGMGLPIDMELLDLSKVSWQSAINTMGLAMSLMESMGEGMDVSAIKGSDVTAMIDSLVPNQQSGLVAIFESFIKGIISEILNGVDLDDVDLELLQNSKQFGVLFDMLAEADSFTVLTKSPSAFGDDDVKVLEKLSDYLSELNKGTAGFKTLVGSLINEMADGIIGVGGDVDDVIDLIASSVKAYKLFVELKNKNPIPSGNLDNWKDMDPAELAESFTPDMAEELIETIANEAILDSVEQMLNEASVDPAELLGEHKDMVQDTFDGLLDQMAENPPEDIEDKLEQYERLADMLGLDTSKLGGLLGGGN